MRIGICYGTYVLDLLALTPKFPCVSVKCRHQKNMGVSVGVGFSDTRNSGVGVGVSVEFRHQKNMGVSFSVGFSDTQNSGFSVFSVSNFDTKKIWVSVSVSDFLTPKILVSVSVSDVCDTKNWYYVGVGVGFSDTQNLGVSMSDVCDTDTDADTYAGISASISGKSM